MSLDPFWVSLSEKLPHAASVAVLMFCRPMGAFALFPMLPQNLPRHVRLAIPVAVWPLLLSRLDLSTVPASSEGMLGHVGWMLAEFALGLLVTLPAGVVFWAAQCAGELIDIKIGANNTAVFGGGSSPEGPAQILMSQFAVLAFLTASGPFLLVEALFMSYGIIPVGAYDRILMDRLPDLVTEVAIGLFAATFQLFGPFFALFLLLEFGIGIAGMLAQQLQIGAVTAPAKSLFFAMVALLLLAQGSWFHGPAAFSIRAMGDGLRLLVGR